MDRQKRKTGLNKNTYCSIWCYFTPTSKSIDNIYVL